MNEPNFDPESAEILHNTIFFSGITERLISSGEISEYENLYSALNAIDAPKSTMVIAEFITLFRPAVNEGFDRLKIEIGAEKARVEELENRYLDANEEVVAMIHKLYEDLDG